jgi:hypothetical protein
MPWSPTTAFKHPLVNVRKSNAESGLTNYLTYAFAEMMYLSISTVKSPSPFEAVSGRR